MILRPLVDPPAQPALVIPTSGLLWHLDYNNVDGESNATVATGTLVKSIVNHGSLDRLAAGGDGSNQTAPMLFRNLGRGLDGLGFPNFHTYLSLMGSETDLAYMHRDWVWDLYLPWINEYVAESTVTGKYSWIFGVTADAARRGFGLWYRDDGLACSLNGNLIQHGRILNSGLLCKPGGVHIIRSWADGTRMYLSLDGGTPVSVALTGAKVSSQLLFPVSLGSFPSAPTSTPGCSKHLGLALYDQPQADPAAIIAAFQERIDRASIPTVLVEDVGDSRVNGSGAQFPHPAAEQAYLSAAHPARALVGNRGVPGQTVGVGNNPGTIPGLVTVANTFIAQQVASRITRKVACIRAGINDIIQGRTGTQVIADLQTVRGYFLAADWEIILDTVEGYGEYGPWDEEGQAELDILNAWIRAQAA